MLKKLLLAVAALVATMGLAFAQVDVNKADQAALDGIKGIGPSMSKRILEERSKNGAFKDWADLEQRVKGVGEKNAVRFSDTGLTVNGQARAKSAIKPVAETDSKTKKPKKEAEPAKK